MFGRTGDSSSASCHLDSLARRSWIHRTYVVNHPQIVAGTRSHRRHHPAGPGLEPGWRPSGRRCCHVCWVIERPGKGGRTFRFVRRRVRGMQQSVVHRVAKCHPRGGGNHVVIAHPQWSSTSAVLRSHQHPGDGVRAAPSMIHLVVRQRDVGQLRNITVNARTQCVVRALTGPLPSPVATMRSPPACTLTVASLTTSPSDRCSTMARHDSTSNVRTCSPSASRSSNSKEASAASKVHPSTPAP